MSSRRSSGPWSSSRSTGEPQQQPPPPPQHNARVTVGVSFFLVVSCDARWLTVPPSPSSTLVVSHFILFFNENKTIRFYGESMPVQVGEDGTGLELLTSQQALADTADFIRMHQRLRNCTARGTPGYCPVVTFGGSYPGFLSVRWLTPLAACPTLPRDRLSVTSRRINSFCRR